MSKAVWLRLAFGILVGASLAAQSALAASILEKRVSIPWEARTHLAAGGNTVRPRFSAGRAGLWASLANARPSGIFAVPDDLPGEPAAASLLESKEMEYAVMSGLITRQVETAIKNARAHMAENPSAYKPDLKLLLDQVQKAPELNSDKRFQLRSELEAVLREVDRRQVEKDANDVAASNKLAEVRETERMLTALATKQEKEKQLMDRFNSLMDEGRYLEAEEGPGAEFEYLDPSSPVGVQSVLLSRKTRYVQQNLDYRVRRQKGVVDTLVTAEIALIPFPDDQPVVYPDAQFWQELTLRRKKYSAVDLKVETPAEKKIKKALSETTTLEFVETPLTDVIDYLKDLHGIEIQIDTRALEDAGSGTDTPITKNLRGISLKSALRLMLQPLDLSYVIKDEVMLITTKEKADAELITKVYPVADLVLPIQSIQMGRMGGGGRF